VRLGQLAPKQESVWSAPVAVARRVSLKFGQLMPGPQRLPWKIQISGESQESYHNVSLEARWAEVAGLFLRPETSSRLHPLQFPPIPSSFPNLLVAGNSF